MKFRIVLTLLLQAFVLVSFGQNTLKGKVIDEKSHEPLAFVNIVINGGRYGTVTNIDGEFEIQSREEIQNISFSYVGYEPLSLIYSDFTKVIRLKATAFDLKEFTVVAGENPAHRIIDLTIDHRKLNNPEKLESFSYTSYDRMVITSDVDSLLIHKDSLNRDTASARVRDFFEKQDLFLMETVTDRKFMKPDRDYSKVIAQRVSGFKDPIFTFLAAQVQSTSFYEPLIHIADKYYVNPISPGSTSKYFFNIEDTLYTQRLDTVFLISFRPKKNTNFEGLEGILSINSYKWAVQNVRTEPAKKSGFFTIRIQQLYELFDDEYWFPVQLNTDVIFNPEMFQAQTDSTRLGVKAVGKSYIKNIVLNPELVKREFKNIAIEIDPKANKRDSVYWNNYRNDSLSKKDKETYRFMDSIGEAEHFDRIVKTAQVVLSGKIPVGIVDLDANQFLNYSDYEGLHVGLGLHTNERVSKTFNVGGFLAYGTKDKAIKYRAEANYTLDKLIEMETGFAIYSDLRESGGTHYFDDQNKLLELSNFRKLLLKQMHLTTGTSAYLRFRALRDFKFNFEFNNYSKEANRGIEFDLGIDKFNFTEASFGFRWAFKEKFYKRDKSKISLGSKFPTVWFNYTQGFDDVFEGNYAYKRYDLKLEKSFRFKYMGKSSFRIAAGYIDGDLPYCNLFNGNGSYRAFTIYAPYSFATMRMNEFLSNKYIALYYQHDFGKLLINSEKFSPEIAIATHAAFGSLNHPDNPLNTSYKTLEKGYYESGLLINKLIDLKIYQLGIGAFYRYGPYSFDKVGDNFAVKLSLTFGFN